jgi:metallo-beta-lactamase family protein
VRLTFLGAAGTVTGSKLLVESGEARVLVDCGLYQGVKKLRLRNWERLPVDPASLGAVVLTHAHIDHSGYLPALVRDGFAGPVFCTAPTRDLAEILLPDSGKLHEEDAAYANRKRFSRHEPALPLYTEEDARRVSPQLAPVAFGERLAVAGLALRFVPAGHILGAASVEIEGGAGRLLVSGDLGRWNDPLMRPPATPSPADWVVLESTYGDRRHGEEDPVEAVAAVLRRSAGRDGILLLPSFAVGRAQSLLYCLHEAFRRGIAPRVPVFVNSPMATDATRLYQRWAAFHRLSDRECAEVFGVASFVRSVEESKRLNERLGPLVILSASGMATGGRVLHHLKKLLPDARNAVLLPGFQVPGTRGADLARGAEAIKIHGEWVPVRAEVVQLGLLSAHADQRDLLRWLAACGSRARRVFLVHGEPAACDALRVRVRDELGLAAHVPDHLEAAELAPRP